MIAHDKFRFSVACHTDDLAVLYCLRALARWAQPGRRLGSGSREIGYGGTKDADWKASGHEVKFRFTEPRFRERFLKRANDLLPNHWQQGSTSDEDPATKQR